MAFSEYKMRTHLSAAIVCSVSLGAISAVAAAADATSGTEGTARTAADGGGLEEVIVTARRRSEDEQRVPIAITSFNAQDLEVRGINNTEMLDHAVINFAPAPANFWGFERANFRIRGLPNVGVYVDGVAQQEQFGIIGDVVDIDRIEVLRGPQGTLFGKNSLAGAIQYVTKAPSDNLDVKFSTTVGDYRRFNVQGSADIPLAPWLLTKITLAKTTRDGYLPSTTVNQEFGSEDNTVARADVLFAPNDKFNARFIFDDDIIGTNGNATTLWGLSFSCAPLADAGNNPGAACPYVAASTHGAPQLAISPKSLYGSTHQWLTASNYNGPELFTYMHNYTLIMNYELNDKWALKGIGSYRDVNTTHFEDFASIGVNMFQGENTNVIYESTGEVQLLFTGDRLTGTTGVYHYTDYHRERRNNWFSNELKADVSASNNAAANSGLDAVFGLPPGTLNIPAFGPPDPDQLTEYRIHGTAFFSEWTWKATDQFQVTAGLRFNRDDSYVAELNPTNPIPIVCCVGSTSESGTGLIGPPVVVSYTNTSPRISLQYQWTPTLMTYFTYSEGFNQGGGTAVALGNTTIVQPYAPETLKNYEVGLRSDWLDRTLRFNASVFYSKYNDVQVTEDIDFNAVTTNGGAGRGQGVEIEGAWAPLSSFQVNWGLAYLDTKFTKVPILPADQVDNQIAPNSPFPYAPKESVTFGIQYDTPVGKGASVTLRADEGWTSWVNTSVASSNVYIPSYGLLSARAIYHPPGGKWDVQLYGTNLTDAFYRTSGFNIAPLGNMNTGELGLPRMYGLTFNFKFE
jgi:iron complex outermembrane receptor protein